MSFELLTSFDVTYAPSAIKKWRSKRTGLQAAIISKETPLVSGYFAVATEVEDDSGTPHTLEHLVFMGSKKYPYKGLLDTLGNVMFSETNAWTAVDQTVYTLTTAGWEGFKTLLPVYLDHILNPTLTDEACYTEVYHVDGEGKEKGVVFSEMQGIENQAWFQTMTTLQRQMFSEKCGYSSETGGLMKNLRLLSNDTIRDFHKTSYSPSNLCVIVSGSVDESEFLKVMEAFDSELPPLSSDHKRPFVESDHPIVRLEKDTYKEIEFSEKDESYGEIAVGWIGPRHDNYEEDLAITLLLEYLCESPISLLTKNLVEINEPLASNLEYNTDDFTYICPYIKMNDVPTDKLSEAKDRLFELMKEHATADEFDLTRMRGIVENSKKKLLLSCEKSTDILTDYVINDFLYSDVEAKALTKNLKSLADYESLSTWSTEQWVDLYQKYLIKNKSSVVVSRPSKKLYKSSKAANKKLIEDRKATLGESGLADLKKKLEDAQKLNDAPIPDELIKTFPVPDPANIPFIKTTTVGVGLNTDVTNDLTNHFSKKVLDDTPVNLPLYINIDQFKSEFISISILMSSMEIPERLLPYFEIFVEIFSLPLEINGKTVPYEDVVRDLQNETVEHSLYDSFNGQYAELVNAHIQVKKENYAKAIEWFQKIFWYTKFDKSRVKVAVDKLINSIPSVKRSGVNVLGSVISENLYTSRSLKHSKNMLANETFYRDLATQITEGDYSIIERDLEEIRESLFKPSNFRILIAGDLSSVQHPVKAWANFLPSQKAVSTMIRVPEAHQVLTPLGQRLSKKAFLITAPASDSTFLMSCTKIPTDHHDPDMARISMASSYLQCVEGPFWRGIRGAGYAYGASVSKSVGAGILNFEVYRGSDGIKAFQAAQKIVNDLADGTVEVDQTLFDGALSSLVNTIANNESNYYSSASLKYLDNVLTKVGPDHNTKFLRQLKKVTKEDMIEVLKKYFVPLFKSESSAVFVCAHPTNEKDLNAKIRAVEKNELDNTWTYVL
ncbi:Presequence protease 1, chloroplastic/mitochondrial [Cyberlindnera fabianii]|uniref:Presequence protease 1, chloroplastic/mitochondrial n=1 Tax=Cyberlindnera fabianii TaxID=36022 RepID=A0A1V2LDN6_CYBFA|nr:Presequence protease 1, chloroplastic/mitochondrial [Cyberlindnera fabianii]